MPRTAEEPAKAPIIRDKAFARRLEQACEQHPNVPTDEYRGKKKWLYDSLREEFGIAASPEAVRKWFTGEARPRPKTMSAIARLLEVDEAWLSLGITPEVAPKEKKSFNAMAGGVVNVVAGLIQMSGGAIAFPDSNDDGTDIIAIIRGHSYSLEVKVGVPVANENIRFKVQNVKPGRALIGVIPSDDVFIPTMVLVPAEALAAHAKNRGDYAEIEIERRGLKFRVGDTVLPEVRDFRMLDDLARAK